MRRFVESFRKQRKSRILATFSQPGAPGSLGDEIQKLAWLRNSGCNENRSSMRLNRTSYPSTPEATKKDQDPYPVKSPNTSFQRTLTRGGFGPLNSDR